MKKNHIADIFMVIAIVLSVISACILFMASQPSRGALEMTVSAADMAELLNYAGSAVIILSCFCMMHGMDADEKKSKRIGIAGVIFGALGVISSRLMK